MAQQAQFEPLLPRWHVTVEIDNRHGFGVDLIDDVIRAESHEDACRIMVESFDCMVYRVRAVRYEPERAGEPVKLAAE